MANLDRRRITSPAIDPDVIADIGAERERQNEQWGGPAHDDRHPDRTGVNVRHPTQPNLRRWGYDPEDQTARTKTLFRLGDGGWSDILAEAVAKAFAEADPGLLREKLIPVAAVVLAWVEAIDRRLADGPQTGQVWTNEIGTRFHIVEVDEQTVAYTYRLSDGVLRASADRIDAFVAGLQLSTKEITP